MTPFVSVILPVYNREDTILRALDSVLMQTFRNMEVIVIDDGSDDSTAEIVRNCRDSRVRLVCLPVNGGANAARNAGIRLAEGTYIAFQDSDDKWLADKLEKQIGYMLSADVPACYCPYILHGENGRYAVPGDYKNRDFCERNLTETLRTDNIIGTPTLIVKRDIFSDIGLFDEAMQRMQDYELAVRLVKKYRVGYVDEPLVHAYRMRKSISAGHAIWTDTYRKLLERHGDFFDLEQFLSGYYRRCDISGDGELLWENIGQLAAVLGDNMGREAERACNRTAIRYLQGQYDAVRDVFGDWYRFFTDHIYSGAFAIYGAGLYGRRAYDDLKRNNCVPRCFLVTEETGTADVEGVPVIPLAACADKEMPVIIAISRDMQGELIQNLLRRGMYKFCVYPFCHSRQAGESSR